MKKLALALMLALHAAGAFAPARTLPLHGFPGDGISRRAVRGRGAPQRKQRPATRRGRRAPSAKGKHGSANKVALVPVKEIDAEGLSNLLQRGDPQAARPLLVNFWATWCVPCRMEFPDLVKIDADYRERGLEFVLISADDVSEIKTSVPKFLREMRAATMPAYLLNASDTEAAISQVDPAWGGELPATFLFDRQGKLAYKHLGIINAAELREAIDKVMSNE
ncbi:MAG TPA: redoxin domain-containing protein [Pyrinomonadaceae bacterium]|nr:redoxin domain-containing protein [Pyrinomonadaceae bacterium]